MSAPSTRASHAVGLRHECLPVVSPPTRRRRRRGWSWSRPSACWPWSRSCGTPRSPRRSSRSGRRCRAGVNSIGCRWSMALLSEWWPVTTASQIRASAPFGRGLAGHERGQPLAAHRLRAGPGLVVGDDAAALLAAGLGLARRSRPVVPRRRRPVPSVRPTRLRDDEAGGVEVGDDPHGHVLLVGLGGLVVLVVLLAGLVLVGVVVLVLGVDPLLDDWTRAPGTFGHSSSGSGSPSAVTSRSMRSTSSASATSSALSTGRPSARSRSTSAASASRSAASSRSRWASCASERRQRLAFSRRSTASGSCSNSAKIAASSSVRSPESSRLRLWSALVTARAAFTVGRSMLVRLAICAALTPSRASCSTPATISASRIPARWMFSTIWSPIRSASAGWGTTRAGMRPVGVPTSAAVTVRRWPRSRTYWPSSLR